MRTEFHCSRSTIYGRLGVIVTAVLLLLLTAHPSQAQPPCREVCLDITAPNDTTACASGTYTGTFVIENCNVNKASLRGGIRPVGKRGGGDGAVQHYVLTATCNGQTVPVTPATLDLTPGEKSNVTVTCAIPATCKGPLDIDVKAVASLLENPGCVDSTTADVRVDCGETCVAVNNPAAIEACPGETVEIPFTVRNCGNVAINVNMMAACNGQIVDTVEPFNFNLNPNQSRISTVTCVVPKDCQPGEFLTVVNSAWAKSDGGCAMDITGNTRINCIVCPVAGSCGPLALVAPPQGGGCPGEAITVSFTVENQGEAPVDVYVRTPTAGWLLSPTVFNNLASGNPVNVTASWTLPPSGNPPALVLHATSYPASTTPADTAGVACANASDVVTIALSPAPCVTVNNPPAIEACAGETVEVPFTVRNCGSVAFNVNMVAACNGQIVNTVEPFNFNLNPGQSRISTVTCVVPADCGPGEFLTVVNSAWTLTGDSCAVDVAGDTRINCIVCPVGGSCGPLSLVAPPQGEGCPGEPITVSFTVENQGEASVDVYVKTPTAGWLLTPTVFNNLASGNTVQVTASRTLPSSGNPSPLVLRATSYPASTTPADTAGLACANATDVVDILISTDCDSPLAEVCPRTIGFWRQQTQQKSGGSRKICEADGADATDMQRLWREVIQLTDLVSFRTNDGSTVTVVSLANLDDGDLFDALGCELEGPRPMTQRDMAEIQYLALLLNVAMGLVDLDTPIDNGTFEGTIGEAIDDIEEILNQSDASDSQLSEAIGIADAINNGTGVRGRPCEGGENGPFANFGMTCPSSNAGFVCPDNDEAVRSLNRAGSVPTRQLSLAAVPNPFNPTAVLRWTARPDQVGQQAVIDVFDAAGRPVAHLFDGVVTAESNELLLAPDGWSSGMYIARLTVGHESIVYRLMLVK
ncbi:MAG: hypothetical protein SGI90_13060 [Candidatus Eisenbacteria bacterium]|nr:hypothetical protein [Candidatus Eisenbacteria bacterium]